MTRGVEPGALSRELRAVHDMLRQDLAAVRSLALAVADGVTAAAVLAELRRLTGRGGLWELKMHCLRYCQLVGMHHRNEDTSLFPAARASAPHIGPALDLLEADHRAVAALLRDVEDRAEQLSDDDEDLSPRAELAASLQGLAVDLFDHLDREEVVLEPVLATWTTWPGLRGR